MEIVVARELNELENAFERLKVSPTLGCDTETSGFTAKQARLYSVQFSDGNLSVLVPISEGIALGPFANLLSNANITKIFHNAKFDLEFLSSNGYEIVNLFDTMIAEKVLTRGANQSASLAETLYRYFAVDLDKSQRAKFHSKWNGIWTDDLVHYALSDVIHLPRLMQEQTSWMEKLGMLEEFADQMKRVVPTTGDTPDALP